MPAGCAEDPDANLAGDLASVILGFFQNSRRKSAGFTGGTKTEAKACSSEFKSRGVPARSTLMNVD